MRRTTRNPQSGLLRPVINYVGGKQKWAHRLLSYFPTEYGNYWEPFLGSAAVYLALHPARTGHNAYLSDTDGHLINFHDAVRGQPGELMREYMTLAVSLTEAVTQGKEEARAFYKERIEALEVTRDPGNNPPHKLRNG